MKQDIEQYVKGCAACQANKANTNPRKPAIFPITPEHTLPFQTVAMDFITKLPKSGKYDTLLTITDHDCSKAVIFIPCQETITAEGVAALYMRLCISQIWSPQEDHLRSRHKAYIKVCQSAMRSTEEYIKTSLLCIIRRTDGQSERTNQWVEQFLRFWCDERQDNWHTWLAFAEFAHNSWPSATTKKSPFDLIMGYTPKNRMGRRAKSPACCGMMRTLGTKQHPRTAHLEQIVRAQKVMKMQQPWKQEVPAVQRRRPGVA
jgi:hypothetical protein